MTEDYKCWKCSGELKQYIYTNPVCTDVITMLCPVCAKDIISEDGWKEFDEDKYFDGDEDYIDV